MLLCKFKINHANTVICNTPIAESLTTESGSASCLQAAALPQPPGGPPSTKQLSTFWLRTAPGRLIHAACLRCTTTRHR
jgi:hypothetical protein